MTTANTSATTGTRSPLLVDETDHALLVDSYRQSMPATVPLEPRLGAAIRDTLASPGSLARAQLAYSLLKGLPSGPFLARDLAIALEYFHTASLLLDDLPCMDNATERRGRTCPHVAHGESAAILGALSFITRAYALLWQALGRIPLARRLRAAQVVEECLGANGILDGQARDLAFQPGADPQEVTRIARGKTVTLIRLTLLLPALVAGCRAPIRRRLEDLAESWGLAYQILDDFKDCLCAARESGKTAGRDSLLGRPNLVVAAGVDAARAALSRHLDGARTAIAGLGALHHAALDRLQALLEHEAARLSERLVATA